ncbi:MAG: site-specific integrase [Clostridia bacterium]|nr:site-specific integrase [Clostridia bacterium]
MEKEQYIDVKNYVREKSGLYYAVMVYTNVRGVRKEKWFPTKLPVKGNKTKAEAISRKILREFEIPREDLCYHEVKGDAIIDNSQPIEPQLLSAVLEKITLSELSTDQVSNLLFADYIKMYLPLTKKRKKRIQEATYSAYCENVKYPIEPYFRKKKTRLKDLTAQDIQDFYDVQLDRVKPNTVIHYHAIIRLALCYARKMGYIKENPIEQVEKPEKNRFVGSYYTTDEVNELILITKGTKLEIPILFACFYGLRRSECVGLRWSAFDFENNSFNINHTIVSTSIDGERVLIEKDSAKTVATIRTMPLSLDIKKRLLEMKQTQENNKKKLKKKYNNKWLDYIMVDKKGDLITPDYITYAFHKLIKDNNMRNIRFHDLRHTCASLLLNKGKGKVTMKDIQEWLGHSDYKTTANTYAHLDLTSKKTSLETLSDIIKFD